MKNYNEEYYIIEQDYSFEENAAYPSESSSNFDYDIVGEDKGLRDDFWVLNTYDMLDALDENKSDIKTISESIDGLSMNGSVLKYSLNVELLSSIPEEERLIFKMSNISTEPVVVHEKNVTIFRKLSIEGVKFYKLSEYEMGDEFK